MNKTHPDRRDFLKMGSAASVVAATIPAALAVAVEEQPNEEGPYDLVIAGGRCVDPETGLDAVRNLGIKGGRIAAISRAKLDGTKTLVADRHVVAPGFIDLHAHGHQLPAASMQAFFGAA